MTDSLNGKTALVTGGGSGIGQATAKLFGSRGANVVVADLNKEGGAETVKLIEADGGKAAFTECDVTDEAAVEAMIKFAVDTFGSLDCAHNNAGISVAPQSLVETTKEDFERVIAVNLTSVFVCMKHEIKQMLEQPDQEGAIVNTASGAALVTAPGQPHYTASKRGVVGLTTFASDEYKHTKIRVNSVLPGFIDTPMLGDWAKNGGPALDSLLSFAPQHRLGTAEEVAEAVVWLCSNEARWISGDSLVVDGGMINR